MFSGFLSFALVGALGTTVHYAVLFFLVEWQSQSPVFASGCGAIAGLLVNYIFNFKFTFNSKLPHHQAFPKFTAIAAVGFGFNLILMQVLTSWMYYFYAQVLTTLLVLAWNFIANSLWTFQTVGVKCPGYLALDNHRKPVYACLSVLAIIRIVTLGNYPLYDPSESRYAEMARKMLETGNWVTPMIDYGVPFWGKPPLTIWLTAFSMEVGAINEFWSRLPSLIFSCGSAWLVFLLVRKQKNVGQALCAVFMLFTTVLFFVMSGTVAMDLALSFGVTLALTAFWLALHGGNKFWGYGFFVGLSMGIMAKGPICLVLAGICIFLWTMLTGRWLQIWQKIPWIFGILIMLGICAPWFVIAEQRTPGFLEYFFIGEHWKRFTETGWKGDLYGAGRAHPLGMIWVYWLAGGFPWSLMFLKRLFAVSAQKQPVKWGCSEQDWPLYCLLWMLSPLLFFTFSANLIWTYVLPGLPGLVLLLLENDKVLAKYALALGLSVPLIFLGLVVFYHASDIDFYKSQKRLVDTYSYNAISGEHLNYLKEKNNYSAQFYLQGKVIELADVDALRKSLGNPQHDYYVLRKAIVDKIPEIEKSRLQLVKEYGAYRLYHAVAD